ncbi:MAG: transketolase [Gammaproteobacteria bacterium]|nr:transketolase [Gammaproteobacteria bacterium]
MTTATGATRGDCETLEEYAQNLRLHALAMTSRGKSSHIGSVFSIADILAVLYGRVLNVRPQEPGWDQRDRFILSKGHAGAGVYAALALAGFFPVERLKDHYQNGSQLSGHVSHKGVPGVELSTGSLGHGLGVGVGMALAAQRKAQNHRVVVLLSDGECDEGSVWEAILFAAHHKLDNVTAIVDYNKIQSLDLVANTLGLEPFADKWSAFGWSVTEVDGHDHGELATALEATASRNGQPNVVIAHTTKGKGVSFMERSVLWHYRSAQGDEFDAAAAELKGRTESDVV